MSLSMDDKLLGEKSHYYCSSSEDEDDDIQSKVEEPQTANYQGTCVNTGPKGVIEDWRKFKQLEAEHRESKDAEKEELVKKLSMTCLSHSEEKRKGMEEDFLLEEIEDTFLLKYREQRLAEMMKMFKTMPQFGEVVSLSTEEFTTAVDSEKPQVMIIVHIYEESSQACEAMNGCLTCLAREYPRVKFCKIRASEARMSGHFVENGVPALLIYRNKELIGNFVRLSDELGEDFFANEVECFLLEHGLLPKEDSGQTCVKDKTTENYNTALSEVSDSGSDFEID